MLTILTVLILGPLVLVLAFKILCVILMLLIEAIGVAGALVAKLKMAAHKAITAVSTRFKRTV